MMKVYKTFIAWMRLFRAHTAILEGPLAAAGAALALGTLFDPKVALWAIFGILYHFIGYGLNSYADWKNGYDKNDPSKQHHPLNTGEITPNIAKYVLYSLFIVLITYGLALTSFSLIGIIGMGIIVVTGMFYNYYGKEFKLKFVPICIAHTLVFAVPYYYYSGTVSLGAGLLIVAIFVHHVFQIVISGDLKDMGQDEKNHLIQLGAELKIIPDHPDVFVPSNQVLKLTYSLTVIQIVIISFAFGSFGISLLGLSLTAMLSLWLLYESHTLIEGGSFNRSKRVSSMSRRELAGFWLIYSALTPVIDVSGVMLIIITSVLYLLPVSKLMWGNWVKPEV